MDLLFGYLQTTGQALALEAHSDYSQGSFDAAQISLKRFMEKGKNVDCCGLLFSHTLMACISILKDEWKVVGSNITAAETQFKRVREFPSATRECPKSEEHALLDKDVDKGAAQYFNEVAFTHYNRSVFLKMIRPIGATLDWLREYKGLYGSDTHHKLMACCEIVRNGAKFSYDRQLVGCIGVNVPVITWLRGVLHNCLCTVPGMTQDARYTRQKTIYDDIYRTATKFPSPSGATLPFVGDTLVGLEALAYFQLPWPMALVPAGRLPYIVVLLQSLSKLVQAELMLTVFNDKSCLSIALDVHKMALKLEKKVNGAEPELNDLFTTIKQQVVAMSIMSGTHHRPTFDQNFPELSRLVAKTPLTNADAVPVETLQKLAEDTLLSAYDAYAQAMHYDGYSEALFLGKKYRLLGTVVERCRNGLKVQVQANFKYQKLTIEDADGRFASKLHCMKGFALYHLGERLEALNAFRTAIRFHPFCFEALNQLTHIYIKPAPVVRTNMCSDPKCDKWKAADAEDKKSDVDDSWSCGMFPWEEFETTSLRFPLGSEESSRLHKQLYLLRLHQSRMNFTPEVAEMSKTPNSIYEYAESHIDGPWHQEAKLIDIERLMLPVIRRTEAEFERDQAEREQIISLMRESDATKKKFDVDLSATKDRVQAKEKELNKFKEQRKKIQGKVQTQRDQELQKLSKEIQSLSAKEKRQRQKQNDLLKNSDIHQSKLESTVDDVSTALVRLQTLQDEAEDEFLQWEDSVAAELVLLERKYKAPPPQAPGAATTKKSSAPPDNAALAPAAPSALAGDANGGAAAAADNKKYPNAKSWSKKKAKIGKN